MKEEARAQKLKDEKRGQSAGKPLAERIGSRKDSFKSKEKEKEKSKDKDKDKDKEKDSKSDKEKRDLSHITCHNCDQKGHYKSDCKVKRKDDAGASQSKK